MVIDIGYLKRVTKRLLTLLLSLVRNIPCFQNGSILHAIFDCVCYSNYGRTYYKMVFEKNKNTKKTKRNNYLGISVCNNCRSSCMGNCSSN